MQVGGHHPGDVQWAQREPGYEQEMCDQENTPGRTDADHGAAADALTLHAPLDARGGGIGSGVRGEACVTCAAGAGECR
ncbi:hypothetical protein GCM10010350_13720 [Streptomyces galilaeus]|nr:hypothetical protein GCM10010350_13720 [Streptomyces galilaeus]